MRPFAFFRAASLSDALDYTASGDTRLLAGGTTLLDLMKLDVERPTRVVDINALDTDPAFSAIQVRDDGLQLGALARMSDAADNADVRRLYPVVAQSLAQAASAQLRNMASLGGNVLQRTRCPYFRDTSYAECNKRVPGSGCAALDGYNRLHAVLGTSDDCIASYPGDFAQALVALEAEVRIVARGGTVKRVPITDLHRSVDDPARETTLEAGDLVAGFRIPAGDYRRSMYLKVRDRRSYAFAAASAAVVLSIEDNVVRRARIALGGVAYRPWRAEMAEGLLVGRPLDEAAATEAADAAFADAEPREHNAYKIPLGKATLIRALLDTARLEI